jgi:hypothetical protein
LLVPTDKPPRFSDLNKVRGVGEFAGCDGYVIASLFRDGRWVYKISVSEDPRKPDSYDNWIPEEFLERTK